MKIGIIGAGRMGQALAGLLVEAGHEVVIANSRGPESLTEVIASVGPGCAAADVADTVTGADVTFLATPWAKTEDAVAVVADWSDRIVVDTTNNRSGPGPQGVIDIGGAVSSEVVAGYMPGARVVKALNVTPIPMMAAALGAHARVSHDEAAGNNAVYIAGDDDAAKKVVSEVIRSIGGVTVDTGDLHTGGRLQGTGGPLAGKLEMLTPDAAREQLRAVTT